MRISDWKARAASALQAMLGGGSSKAAAQEPQEVQDSQEVLWQQTYDARQQYFESRVGPLPHDIQKMLSTSGVWPGGGLYAIPAAALGQGMTVYTTFGFTNPDMPASVRMVDFKLEPGDNGAVRAGGRLEAKQPAPRRPGAAGYGYEIMVVAQDGLDWPINLLQWAVHAELANDVGFLERVETYRGLTVERLEVGAPEPLNILVSKALPPLPTGTELPAGKMELLVITTISAAEMQWSMEHGRDTLLARLHAAGVGQISTAGRADAVR